MEQIKQVHRATIAKIERLDDFEDEFVYDIGIYGDTPYFFANNILVHNSSYFSIENALKTNPERFAGFGGTREEYIALYDGIADAVNDTFAEFMNRKFNTGLERGGFIKAGRELVASRALFIKKKKYAALIYDNEGKREDVGGKAGKLKVMGLDLKRADTPKIMQEFLNKILYDLLSGASREDLFEQIREFRTQFRSTESWWKGTPRAVNGLTAYYERVQRSRAMNMVDRRRITDEAKVNLPQQVRASINWNELCDFYEDEHVPRITDGGRIIVCRLLTNSLGITSIAFPYDEVYLPKWFKELPFDDLSMENIVIDKKIGNMLDVLEWDLSETNEQPGLDVFSFF